MKKIIESIRKRKDKILFWSSIYDLSSELANFIFKLISDKIVLKYKYKSVFKKKLDLKNPKTLNEKIQWKKIYDKKEIYTICTDKYKVRQFVSDRVGKKYLIPLITYDDNIDKINLYKIKLPFIIKTNHGSGQNIIIKSRRDINEKEIKKKCESWLKTNFYYVAREWQYKNIKPLILVEKLMLNKMKKIPEDYKFHCFNGKVEFIQVVTDRFEDKKMSFFDKNWKLLPFSFCSKKNNRPEYNVNLNVEKPKNLRKMIYISEILSKDFDYVRADLYSINNKIYFGELTFSPGAGFETFFPSSYDLKFGSMLKIGEK